MYEFLCITKKFKDKCSICFGIVIFVGPEWLPDLYALKKVINNTSLFYDY